MGASDCVDQGRGWIPVVGASPAKKRHTPPILGIADGPKRGNSRAKLALKLAGIAIADVGLAVFGRLKDGMEASEGDLVPLPVPRPNPEGRCHEGGYRDSNP